MPGWSPYRREEQIVLCDNDSFKIVLLDNRCKRIYYKREERTERDLSLMEDRLKEIQNEKIRFILGERLDLYEETLFKFDLWERRLDSFQLTDRNEFLINLIDAFLALKKEGIIFTGISPDTVMCGYGNKVYFTDPRAMSFKSSVTASPRDPWSLIGATAAPKPGYPTMFTNLALLIYYYCTGNRKNRDSIIRNEFPEIYDDDLLRMLLALTRYSAESRYTLEAVCDDLKNFFRTAGIVANLPLSDLYLRVVMPSVPADKELPQKKPREALKNMLFELSRGEAFKKALIPVVCGNEYKKIADTVKSPAKPDIGKYGEEFKLASDSCSENILSVVDELTSLSNGDLNEETLDKLSNAGNDVDRKLEALCDKYRIITNALMEEIAGSRTKSTDPLTFLYHAMKSQKLEEYQNMLLEYGLSESYKSLWLTVKNCKDTFEKSDVLIDRFIAFCLDDTKRKDTEELKELFRALSAAVPKTPDTPPVEAVVTFIKENG
ncbi:MAG: hypothetical protein IKB34_00380 [Clostridia bacterium]|nr:hypothetical protein [Clostridia bacterium]